MSPPTAASIVFPVPPLAPLALSPIIFPAHPSRSARLPTRPFACSPAHSPTHQPTYSAARLPALPPPPSSSSLSRRHCSPTIVFPSSRCRHPCWLPLLLLPSLSPIAHVKPTLSGDDGFSPINSHSGISSPLSGDLWDLRVTSWASYPKRSGGTGGWTEHSRQPRPLLSSPPFVDGT